jgi:superfamily II DNA or RNA helicase
MVDKSYCYFGGDTLKYYSDDNNLITTSFSSSSGDVDTRTVVYATTHMDEGVDIDKLDILILTSGGSKKRRVVQRVGRVSRLSKTLKKGIVIDFTDSEQAVLRSQSVKRKSYTKSLGVIIEDDVSTLTSLHNSLDIIEKE